MNNTYNKSKRRKILNRRLTDFLVPLEIRQHFKTIRSNFRRNKNQEKAKSISHKNKGKSRITKNNTREKIHSSNKYKQNLKINKTKKIEKVNNNKYNKEKPSRIRIKIKEKHDNNRHNKRTKTKTIANSQIPKTSDSRNKKSQPTKQIVQKTEATQEYVYYTLLMYDIQETNQTTTKTRIRFEKLLKLVQEIKLPSPQWKIKVVVKQHTIGHIAFSNKAKCERCVHFYRHTGEYQITFGGIKVVLIGIPQVLSTLYQLNILLDIVHNICENDPILEYSNT